MLNNVQKMTDNISFKNNKADYLLSFTALGQSLFSLIQMILTHVFHYPPEFSTRVRMLLTALPILFSFFYILKRKNKIALFSYIVVVFILMVTVIMWPNRWDVMKDDVLKFLLPVIRPTGLCVISIRNYSVIYKTCKIIAICSTLFGFLYLYYFYIGTISIDNYSMGFSYSLLLPIVILMIQKNLLYKALSLLLTIAILAVGARGPFLCSCMFMIVNYFWGKLSMSRIIIYIGMLYAASVLLFNVIIGGLISFFDNIGIESRTLRLLANDDLISHTSGRDNIQDMAWSYINENPILGNGVWADRAYAGTYCHNLLIEWLLDFGYVVTGFILILAIISHCRIIKKMTKDDLLWLILFFFGCIVPLFASSSYLINGNFGLYIGFMYLLNKKYQAKLTFNRNRTLLEQKFND